MMDAIAGWSPRRRLLTCCLAGAILAMMAAVAVMLVHAPTAHRSAPAPVAPARVPTSTTVPTPDPGAGSQPAHATLPGLVRTDDPIAYARATAQALFDVDPAAVSRSEFVRFWLGELPSVVYSDAATKGLALATQNTDVIHNLTSSWIPTQTVWTAEAAGHTTSQFTITSVSVPDYWVNAIAGGEFRDPGLQMERVMGVLTQRYGTDAAHRHSTSRSVVIDLGLLCGPTQPGGCRLVAPQQPPDLGNS
jgi:hypothetical protein